MSRCRRNLHTSVMISLCLAAVLYFPLNEAFTRNLKNMNEENWRDTLSGEWMIEFHAPWCPACRDLKKAWDSFADWSEDLQVHVAEIDVTVSPGLSGRFLVTALPTIYHVKDGVFRLYTGSRDKDDFISFIEDKKWSSVNPIPAWKHPDTVQMTIVSYFFKISMSVRDLHNYMVEKQGLPSWGSYAIFGLTTLVLGCILGFVIVYLIDYIFPTSSAAPIEAPPSSSSVKDSKKKFSSKKSKPTEESPSQKGGSKKSDKESNSEAETGKPSHRSTGSRSHSEAEEEMPRQRKKQLANGSPDVKN